MMIKEMKPKPEFHRNKLVNNQKINNNKIEMKINNNRANANENL